MRLCVRVRVWTCPGACIGVLAEAAGKTGHLEMDGAQEGWGWKIWGWRGVGACLEGTRWSATACSLRAVLRSGDLGADAANRAWIDICHSNAIQMPHTPCETSASGCCGLRKLRKRRKLREIAPRRTVRIRRSVHARNDAGASRAHARVRMDLPPPAVMLWPRVLVSAFTALCISHPAVRLAVSVQRCWASESGLLPDLQRVYEAIAPGHGDGTAPDDVRCRACIVSHAAW